MEILKFLRFFPVGYTYPSFACVNVVSYRRGVVPRFVFGGEIAFHKAVDIGALLWMKSQVGQEEAVNSLMLRIDFFVGVLHQGQLHADQRRRTDARPEHQSTRGMYPYRSGTYFLIIFFRRKITRSQEIDQIWNNFLVQLDLKLKHSYPLKASK